MRWGWVACELPRLMKVMEINENTLKKLVARDIQRAERIKYQREYKAKKKEK